MKRTLINKEVDLTLSSLDNLVKAKVPDKFAESVTKQIIFREEQLRWVSRAKYALAAMIAMALINTALLLFGTRETDRESMLDSIAKEWKLSSAEF